MNEFELTPQSAFSPAAAATRRNVSAVLRTSDWYFCRDSR